MKIIDRRTKAEKEILVFKLRNGETDEIYKVAAGAMLVHAWEDIVDELGNGDESTTNQKLRGEDMSIIRGEDTRTAENNPMGTYEIVFWNIG